MKSIRSLTTSSAKVPMNNFEKDKSINYETFEKNLKIVRDRYI